MAKTQRLHEVLSGSATPEYLAKMNASGWRLVAPEWERESDQDVPDVPGRVEEVPCGMQVAGDCCHLTENAVEMRVLMSAVNMIVEDIPLSRVAEELNRRGYRTRRAASWTAAAVFDLIPRMIEAGPGIFRKNTGGATRIA